MKKKGFTLIELLAVIVILAVITLIAVPTVLNIIEDSRKESALASAKNIISTAKTYYMSNYAKGETTEIIDLSSNILKYNGEQVKKGYVTFEENGDISGKMYIDGYCIKVEVNNKITSERISETDCDTTTYKRYLNGTPLLFNPKTGKKCTSATSSVTGTNDTCMKWYAFLDNVESSTVNLILDHNTTGKVAWNSDKNGTTPDTVNAQLQTDIVNWNSDVKKTARLISAVEINKIAPTKSGYRWNQNETETWYYLHNGNQKSYTGAVGTNKYDWLFDNTQSCTTYGCNLSHGGTFGYWTSDFAGSKNAWFVRYTGALSRDHIENSSSGVRPVITVSKSVFE